MLNDLLALERGMTAYGIDLVGRHPDIKDMAKGAAIRTRLGADGSVVSVEIVPEAGRGVLWTLRDGQHNGFPGLKTAAGLLQLDDEARDAHKDAWDRDKTPAARRDELLRLIDKNAFDMAQLAWPTAGHRQRIRERLEALLPLADTALTAAVPAAFERFLVAVNASPTILQRLLAALAERVRARGDDLLDPVRNALIGPVALAIDVAEDDFERDAGDPRQVAAVSAALSVSVQSGIAKTESGVFCALSGQATQLHTGNFPQPNLPGLGQTYIFSRNRDIPSLTRFGRSADESFAVGADLVRRLAGAITALTNQDAKGKTWRLIPAETGDKPDLLVVSMADREARPADALADDDEVSGQAALNELGTRVIDQSEGIDSHGHSVDEVTVLILRTVDPANRKAVYHRHTTPLEFSKAAKRWQAASKNTPDWLGLPCPVKGKSEAVFKRPVYVSPLSITPLSRIQFTNGGQRRVDVIGAPSATAFSLFIHEGGVERHARTLLRMLLRRHGILLSALAAARTEGIDRLKYIDPKADLRRDALRSISWIGALLYDLGRLKEIYVTDIAFRLGQLLETADLVHIGYCADVRDGDVPPNLLGNSVLSIAGADPERALSILESRMKPYLAWAKREERIRAKVKSLRTRDGNEDEKKKASRLSYAINNAFYTAPRLKELADQLRPIINQKETSDAFRAELLLGYLAGLPPVAKTNTPAGDQVGSQTNSNEEEPK